MNASCKRCTHHFIVCNQRTQIDCFFLHLTKYFDTQRSGPWCRQQKTIGTVPSKNNFHTKNLAISRNLNPEEAS